MKKVLIIGTGPGNKNYIHKMTLQAVENSDCLIGAKRMLKEFEYFKKEVFICCQADKICDFIKNSVHENFGVLVSGDSGFYSLSKRICELLIYDKDILIENIPALSSLQYFSAKLNLPWDDIKVLSVHGRHANIMANIMFNKKVFLLTGGEFKVHDICKMLEEKGLGYLNVSVGENLSYNNERIIQDRASNIKDMYFEDLSVMIVHNDEAVPYDIGLREIDDEKFITGNVPMTKKEVRTVSISKLKLNAHSVVYDIGAGTGTISVDTALKLNDGVLYAVEKNQEALDLINKNIRKFKAYNIEVVKGTAPDVLFNLQKPDSVFIGGTGGNMDEIIKIVLDKNPYVNIVINTITLQSLNESLRILQKYKFTDTEIVNMSVSKSKKVGKYDMMIGQNPIYIISGKGSGSN